MTKLTTGIRAFNIRTKLMLLGIGSVLITAVAMVIVGVWQGNVFSAQARIEAEKLINADLNHITESMYNLIKAQDESIQQKVNHDLNVARYVLNNAGNTYLSPDTVEWTAINQYTQEPMPVNLPKMMVGETWLGQNNQMWVETPVVDLVKRLVGGTATIFQRMNAEGDILRVATNVEKIDGTRAIGTFIPAINPDGTPNPVVSTVMQGETYRGIAYVVNAWYVTSYEPMYDERGEIIGVLYVGVKQENIESLREAILQVRIGATGYVFILGGRGDDRGQYIVSKDGQRDGEDLWETKDTEGRFFIQSIVEKAVALKPGNFATERYPWQNPEDPAPRMKIARLAYYEPWDWVIGASVYEDELQGFLLPLTTGYRAMIRMFSVVAMAIALLGGVVTWLFAQTIAAPLWVVTRAATKLTQHDLPQLVRTMQAVDEGDLSVSFQFEPEPVHVSARDELGTMAHAFTSMNMALVTVGNAFTQMVANLRELTEQLEKRVEERTRELQESERRMADIINFLPDATLVINREGQVIAWNRAIEEMTEVHAEDIVGKGDYAYAIPFYGERRPMLIDLVLQPQETFEKQYAALRREGQTVIGETYVSVKRGRMYITGTASALYDSTGRICGAIESVRDITGRKKAEEAQQEAKAVAESANVAKSAFLATMSHEIRTPMNGVIGMTSLLLDTDLTTEQRDFVETIRHSGDALLTIINDILDFSKIEAGKMALEIQPFNLRECIESVLDLLITKAEEQHLELGVLMDPSMPAMIVGDVTRLRQILVNLLNNALKFTPQGEVMIHVTGSQLAEDSSVSTPQNLTSHIPHRPSLYDLHFTVRDTGIGIPQDRIDRLFHSFSQVDASTTRKYGGTGLGLAISKRLAELMGGAMWVESEEGIGSKFHFTIQAEVAETTLPVYLVRDQPVLQGKRVLVVDDNNTNLKILSLQAQSWKMHPVVVNSGAAALTFLRQGEHVDLAILDMHMPEMDGLMLAEEIRRLRDRAALPLVMLSSIGQTPKDSRSDLFVAFLCKPVKASQLYNTLIQIFADDTTSLSGRCHEEKPAISRFDPTMGKRLSLRILLAEDNATNQKLALRLLERLGYRADIAGNGVEALEALQQRPYDVVLMDLQMPEMDGLEATRCIRERETRTVQSAPQFPVSSFQFRTTIIAMTANAMQGDREICLQAGMDDYLSKPIRVEELVAVLRQCHRKKQRTARPQPNAALERVNVSIQQPERAASPGAKLDQTALDKLMEISGDDGFFAELIESFLTTSPRLVADLRRSADEKEDSMLSRTAHTLKSGSADFGALALSGLCQKVELLAKSGCLDGAIDLVTRIETEYEHVRAALKSLQQDDTRRTIR